MLGFIFACLLTILPFAVMGMPWYISFIAVLFFVFVPGPVTRFICNRYGYGEDIYNVLDGCISDYMLYPIYLLAAVMTTINLSSVSPTTFGIILIICFAVVFLYKTYTFIGCIIIHRKILGIK